MNLRLAAAAAAITLPLTVNVGYASCGAAFCMVNTNWSMQGLWNQPGPRFDLRYEYIDQDQPMAGDRRVAVGEISQHHDEVSTLNRNLFGTLDYGFTPEWGMSLIVPYVDRRHEHIHNHRGEKLIERWDFSEVGDVRVLGRWQTALADTAFDRAGFGGLTFGLKLPTGKHDVTNGEGAVAERSLQPGTGTTDLIVGGYYRVVLPLNDLSGFVQLQAVFPLNERDNYRPGVQAELDGGLRYEASERLGLMLQLLYRYKDRDKGSEAEPANTGGHVLAIAPGASFAITNSVQLYGFVQLPLYQYVNGVQLTADWAAVAGVSAQF
jgi:hypothetical protein